MKNKWFVSLLMVVVMMCACWTGVLAEDEERETFTSGDYEYALLDDGTIEITKYNGSADHLAIPATLDGKTVTAIGDYAFARCSSLTSVSIPDSVTSFGDGAFFACDSLTSITIPDSVVQIGVNPFKFCSALKNISVSPNHPYFSTIDGVLFRKADKALISYPAGISSSTYTIPQGITAIGDGAFYYCKSLTSVSIPDSVSAIGDSAFFSCDSLTSVSIPDSVTSIGDHAFSYCDSLTSVSIPDSVEQIGTNPFSSCSKLKTISVSSEHLYFATIDGVLFRKADKALISYPAGISSSTYTIPQGITAIRDGAFYSCDFLTSVSIPDSVTSIGDYAFSDCSSLTSVSIPASVTSIGDGAFCFCASLTSVSIPASVTSIGDYAFSDCYSLTSVSIPDSVTSIGDKAFYFCPNLTLTVPRNSYAAEYAKTNGISYTYPDANDWLNN